MTEFTTQHLVIRIKTTSPREYLTDLHAATITAIQELTKADDQPMTPTRSEAVYYLAELLKEISTV
ncbi:MAG: hypothetical protein H6581_06390 [Bacteroidia bacterium]|nr:hypothetical protein [Bacteroidia bacterium]